MFAITLDADDMITAMAIERILLQQYKSGKEQTPTNNPKYLDFSLLLETMLEDLRLNMDIGDAVDQAIAAFEQHYTIVVIQNPPLVNIGPFMEWLHLLFKEEPVKAINIANELFNHKLTRQTLFALLNKALPYKLHPLENKLTVVVRNDQLQEMEAT